MSADLSDAGLPDSSGSAEAGGITSEAGGSAPEAGGSVPPPRISIVVPAFNEGAILRGTLEQIVAAFPDAEVIVVDDGSSDDTAEVARSFAPAVAVLSRESNVGKGYAVRVGMLAAEGHIVLFTDADLPFGVAGIERLVRLLDEHPEVDAAIARKIGAYRGLSYRAARAVVRAGVRRSLRIVHEDTQAGLKGFRRKAAHAIFSECVVNGFAADMEVLALAQRDALVVESVPLRVVNDALRPSTFTVGHGVRLIREIRQIRRRLDT